MPKFYICAWRILPVMQTCKQCVSEGEVKEECGSSGDTSDDKIQLTNQYMQWQFGPWKHSLFRIKIG